MNASLALENDAITNLSSLKAKLIELEEDLKRINAEKKDVKSFLKIAKKSIQEKRSNISTIQAEISNIESIYVHDAANKARLQELGDLLRADFNDLKTLKWKP